MKEKRRKNRIKRVTITRRILILILTYSILFIIYYSMTTLSRYTSTGLGSGGTSIARWDVSVDGDNSVLNDELELVSGNTPQSYNIKVTCESEVATKYSVVISDVPNDLEISIDGGSFQTPTNHEVTFTDIGTFPVNSANTEHQHTLTFNAPLNSNVLGDNEINIRVKFNQIL